MNKVEVKIESLSYAKSGIGSYLAVLTDIESGKKLPIIINPNDAQFIAGKISNINTTKPAMPEVIKALTDSYQIDVMEVVIYLFEDDVFYSKLVTTNSLDTFEFDCTVSTALSMAAVYHCPIYVNEEIMYSKAFELDDEGNPIQKGMPPLKTKVPVRMPKMKDIPITVESLSKLLEEAVEREDYEEAVSLRNKIDKMKKV